MKKIFLSIFIIAISFSFVNAESKATKTDDELIKEIQALTEQKKELNQRIGNAKLETSKSQKELEKAQKLGKSLDELEKVIGVDKK